MKPKTIILMVLAVVCGLVASYMTSQLLARDKEMVTVVVARKDIKPWTTIRDPKEFFETRDIQKSKAHANFYPASDFDKLATRRMKSSLATGEELTQEFLLDPKTSGPDTILAKGMRALPIGITAEKAVGFWVVPGSYVDLVHTNNGRSELLMENILVLAIDLQMDRLPEKPGMIGGTAILQLDKDQVLKVASARERGSIALVMRPSGDDSVKTEKKEEMAIVAPPPPPPLPPEPKPEVVKVETTPATTPGTPTSPAAIAPVKPKAEIHYMDIYGSSFVRVEGIRNEAGQMIYTQKTYDEAIAPSRAKPEPPPEKPMEPKAPPQ